MPRPQFAEETILTVAKTTLSNARNNLAALAEFGVSEDMLSQFETDITTTEALPRTVNLMYLDCREDTLIINLNK